MARMMRLHVGLVTGLLALSGLTDAFWRLPCRGRTGLARIDPLMDPGKPSSHVHAVHGSGGFSMSASGADLKASSCTSCAVTQDKSAYWIPALYFMHENGDAEIVNQVGGMLAYYLLYGENVTAFPDNFRMIAGDTYLRDFPWPIPDPPKSEWTGKQASQEALRQKAIGFNCLNYALDPEPSLGRHFLPNKTYLDEHCTDGVRFELMFPSCWNGKDVDSDDHKSHVAYPSLVMDGTCPEGFETRLVSLFYESIWDTYAFKDKEGYFVIANGDPTGYGYHGDFMQGWESGVLQQAVEQCTNPSGEVEDCAVFNIQSEDQQQQCTFDMPPALKHEKVTLTSGGLPNHLAVQWGPAYASDVSASVSSVVSSALSAATHAVASASAELSLHVSAFGNNLQISKPTSTWTPTPTTSYVESAVTQAVVYVEQEIIVWVDGQKNILGTGTGSLETLSTTTRTTTRVVSTVVTVPTDTPVKREEHVHHVHKRHGHGHLHQRS
ncbi:hypothetical protein ALT_6216 [Aspergillus lentulus]|uniref:DUF1996 domain-containing protein n=1 Tax=Aspergillus lentulus TaxID=293939 RepID=A0AAN5YFA9_ASPLE|nr:uncharacterized protein IFM58399_01085 [Aspergillus lentulus]KAF4151226.1 hypothetical protein CNMCM6069_004316 [Aspergillus lentulus]KAF4162901.1 hypothetical protein CNMCM6936_001436 [Aspergillus lentulus]KAF4170342.1 hypothetical protein CNMCM8060_005979 [Aspergillus lentulus]KAF4176697.1 hypothetical protein CNMCM7927_003886 [Aspergillus lentulus]KAF4187024.1 hypothetical protein CNMCM8694_005780 [Aspergillus lentulus]